jgi:hypothetical protein
MHTHVDPFYVAWMMNGLLQVLNSGVVPGNRNADNIDPELRQFDHIAFLDRSLHTYGVKAGLLVGFLLLVLRVPFFFSPSNLLTATHSQLSLVFSLSLSLIDCVLVEILRFWSGGR